MRGGLNYIYLSKNADSSISISTTDILFLTKLKKGKPREMDLPLLKNDITNYIGPMIFTFSLQILKLKKAEPSDPAFLKR
jgi:hypothetical protein